MSSFWDAQYNAQKAKGYTVRCKLKSYVYMPIKSAKIKKITMWWWECGTMVDIWHGYSNHNHECRWNCLGREWRENSQELG